MRDALLPEGFRLEPLSRTYSRKDFRSGRIEVDDWLASKAMQSQEKRLTLTKVLLDGQDRIVGFFTLAIGQVDFNDLPSEVVKSLPRRILPVLILAWLGVASEFQGRGFGEMLAAHALRQCWTTGQGVSFIGVVVDCLDEPVKAFYKRFDFVPMPAHPLRLYLSFAKLEDMIR